MLQTQYYSQELRTHTQTRLGSLEARKKRPETLINNQGRIAHNTLRQSFSRALLDIERPFHNFGATALTDISELNTVHRSPDFAALKL